jgi:hypothetical protein
MNKNRFTLFEVASILRKQHLNKLNYKEFNKFTEDDFDGVEYVKVHGTTRPKDYVNADSRTYKVIKALSPSGEEVKYNGIADICDALDIKAKNYWRKFAEKKGYTIISVEEFFKEQNQEIWNLNTEER